MGVSDLQARFDELVGRLLESENPFGEWAQHPVARAGMAVQARLKADPRARQAGALAGGLVLGRMVSRLGRY
jgi:hypothetical protein